MGRLLSECEIYNGIPVGIQVDKIDSIIKISAHRGIKYLRKQFNASSKTCMSQTSDPKVLPSKHQGVLYPMNLKSSDVKMKRVHYDP